ncbi:MAG: GAF domain-containing sensor histidine kinase [Anaerolineae bacterium]|nr:GAF domain-containing sensor histidine kinase [Anaerolineae bacterium]
MALSEDLRFIMRSVLALIHLVPLFFLVSRRREKRHSYVPPILYCALSALWGIGVAIAAGGAIWMPAPVVDIAGYIDQDLPLLLAALLVPIAFQNVDRRGHWVWWAVGAVGSATALVMHIFVFQDPTETRLVAAGALVGWLIFACLVIVLAAWWALRAPLAFYRNRGDYLLMLLVPLLAGHVFAWVQWRWVEIGLALHLLGTLGVILLITTRDLPSVKRILRRILGNTVVTITTALLLLIGLVTGQLVSLAWGNLTMAIAVSVGLAIILALIYQPFHRFVTRVVNRILWRGGYDPTEVLQEYGRTISSLLTLEQLATVAVGTLSDVLGVQRGALVMIARGSDRVTLRVTEGMGHIKGEEIVLALDSPILLRLMMAGEPFFQYDVDHHPDVQATLPQEKEALRALGMEIYLPILARERVLGLLVLGPQGSGEPYGEREVTFLSTLAQQTGVALQNAYLYSRMKGLYDKISRLNEDLRAAYTKLMKMDQAKTDFLSIASHELRTPLTVIQGYTDILEEMAGSQDLPSERVLEIAKNLKTPIERLGTIVTAMLDASTIEVHALDLQYTATTLQAVMSMAIGPWRDALRERDFDLLVEGVDDIPPIEADLQRLSQAFSNVLSNAIKYTPDNGRVSISAAMIDSEHFEVIFTDTGVGIDPGDQELIFEKFYRVGSLLLHSTGDTKFKGAGPGLGLHIARGVIEAHGGQIWVESEGFDEEKCPGSAFHVMLPLKPASPEAEQ